MTVTVTTLIAPARRAMIASGALTAAGAVLSIGPYVALRNMAAIWLGESDRSGWAGSLWAWAGLAVGSLLAAQLLYLWGLAITHLAEARLRHHLRARLVDAIGRLPLGRVAQIPHGAIRKMVCDDTSSIHTLVAHVPGDVTNALVGAAAGAVYLAWTDWRLALTLVGAWCLVLGAVAATAMRGLGDITDRFAVAQTGLAAATVEMLEGIKEIKSFQATDITRTRFDAARRRFSDLSYEWVLASGRMISLMGALLRPAVVFATVAPLAALFVARGWSEPSATLVFFLLAPGLPEGLLTVVSMMQQIYESRMAARATADLLSQEPMPEGSFDDGDGPAPGRVEVDDVTFSYEPGAPVLKGVSFTARPGAVTALVGPSGGGKSTLMGLMGGALRPARGSVLIDGKNLAFASAEEAAALTARVAQTTWLFTGTIADNLRLAKEYATREEMWNALRGAQIADEIERMPKGLDTDVGEQGAFLSGGQAQRISIARALLSGRRILLLDEPTSQVDIESEARIVDALRSLGRDLTVVLVTHRSALLDVADKVYEMKDGMLFECAEEKL